MAGIRACYHRRRPGKILTTVLTTLGLFLSPLGPLTLPCAAATAEEHCPATIRLLPDGEFFTELTRAIRQASQEITMAYFLIKPSASKDNKPTAIMHELGLARKRGVQVTVLLERSDHFADVDTANNRAAAMLREQGIQVRFDAPNRTTHAKLAVIDRRFCFIGSHNLTQAALTYNHEFSLLLDDREIAAQLLHYISDL